MPAKPKFANNQAFTLIELLIVIAIIAILTALLFVSFTTLQKNARDTQRKSDLQTIAAVLQRFYSDNSRFPSDDGTGKIQYRVSDCADQPTYATVTWGTSGLACGSPLKTYSKQLPKDPTGTKEYCYKMGATNQTYTLNAKVEGNGNLTTNIDCGGSSGTPYNYSITPND